MSNEVTWFQYVPVPVPVLHLRLIINVGPIFRNLARPRFHALGEPYSKQLRLAALCVCALAVDDVFPLPPACDGHFETGALRPEQQIRNSPE